MADKYVPRLRKKYDEQLRLYARALLRTEGFEPDGWLEVAS